MSAPLPLTLMALLQEPAVIVAISLGFLTAAVIVFNALKGKKRGTKLSVRHFFRGTGENGAGVSPYIGMFLVAKRELTHDTILFRFALDKATNYTKGGGRGDGQLVVAGIAPGKHIQIRATIDGVVVNRSYSPVSNDFEEACNGLLDVVVKVYDENHPFPGLMTSKFLNKLSVGDTVEMRGATGMVQYNGNGEFSKSGKPVVVPSFGPTTNGGKFGGTAGKHIVLIGGGSGVTPCLAILKAIMSSKCPQAVVTHRDHWSQETHPPSSPMSPSVAFKDFNGVGDGKLESRLEAIFNATCAPMFGGKGCTATTPSTDDQVEAVTFLICNHKSEDILGREWLQDIAFPSLAGAASSVLPGGVKFIFFNSRSDAKEKAHMNAINRDWKERGYTGKPNTIAYESGRLSAESIQQYVPAGDDVDARPFVVLCGPDGLLNETCKPTLASMGYAKEQLLVV